MRGLNDSKLKPKRGVMMQLESPDDSLPATTVVVKEATNEKYIMLIT